MEGVSKAKFAIATYPVLGRHRLSFGAMQMAVAPVLPIQMFKSNLTERNHLKGGKIDFWSMVLEGSSHGHLAPLFEGLW